MNVIELNNISEKYNIKFIRGGKSFWEEVWVLHNISFNVPKGHVFGIIGQNGAGKTTLLRLIAGMLRPDKGNINVRGRVSMLMDLGAGFNPEFTGRENIILNAKSYGISDEKFDEQINKVIDFAQLDRFIDTAVKYYSQGMYMRLAFALAIYVEPDILLIDDILAVGDEETQQRCIDKIFDLKKSGTTIVVVSHNLGIMEKLCDRVIFVDKGRIIYEGQPKNVIARYLELSGNKKGIASLAKDNLRVVFNNGKIFIDYYDISITKILGGYVGLYCPDLNSWISSMDLEWRIADGSSDDGVSLEGRNKQGMLAQKWVLRVRENEIEFNIQTENLSYVPYFNLALLSDYKRWVSMESEGEFPHFENKLNWQEVNCDNDKDSNIVGVAVADEGVKIPFLLFSKESDDLCLKLLNTGYEHDARIIQAFSHEEGRIFVRLHFLKSRGEFESRLKQAKDRFKLLKQQQELSLRSLYTIASGDISLFADAKTKSIKVYYKNREITKGIGLHTSFLVNRTWYDNSMAEWEVANKDNKLTLKLFFRQLQLAQTWTFSFKDGGLIWEVDSQFGQALEYGIFKFGLSALADYKSFFCGHQVNGFPDKFTSWQDVPLENPKAYFFGLNKEDELPAIIIENKQDLSCMVQNSDIESSCRMLQLKVPQDRLTGKEGMFFSTKVDIQDKNYDFTKRQYSISWSGNAVSVDLDNKIISLYNGNKKITKGNGFYSGMQIKNKGWVHSFDANWQIFKFSDRELILDLEYPHLPITQRWEFKVSPDNCLDIGITMQVYSETTFMNQDLRLQLDNFYSHWRTCFERGFLSQVSRVENFSPVRMKYNAVSKVNLYSGDTSEIVPLTVKNCSDRKDYFLSMYLTEDKSTFVQFESLISRVNQDFKPGNYIYFKGALSFADLDVNGNISFPVIAMIEHGELEFMFEQGRGRIVWNNQEITDGLGFYTSLRNKGIWHDSSRAIWHLKEEDAKMIALTGDWAGLPVSQDYYILKESPNTISIRIEIEVFDQVDIDIQQVSLMLSSRYSHWVVADTLRSRFLDEYTDEYDILPFRFWYGNVTKEGISCEGNGMPDVHFICRSQTDNFKGIIENTDSIYQARLLQYQKQMRGKLFPGRYKYFEGNLKVGP